MNKQFAYTLSEVLITLAIVGVVATMTLPVLINKINEKQYDRAREKALNTIGEAGRIIAIQGDMNSATNTEDLVKNYLSKKLKIVKTCPPTKLTECGVPTKIKKIGGETVISMPTNSNTSYGFLMANGYSVNLFYNPNCIVLGNLEKDVDYTNIRNSVCINAIYDMNGLKNPNQIGKDIGFVTILYSNETSRAVAPNPYHVDMGLLTLSKAQKACSSLGKEYTLPNKEELISMSYNSKLIDNITTNAGYISASTHNGYVFRMFLSASFKGGWFGVGTSHYVRCVKR